MEYTPKRFDRAFAALVAAFFNNTLQKSNCTACAIGNITAAANGIKLRFVDGYVEHDMHDTAVMCVKASQAGIPLITPSAPNRKSTNCKIPGVEILDHAAWSNLFMTDGTVGLQSNPMLMRLLEVSTEAMQKQGEFVIKATGYTVPELMKVEKAFEQSAKILHKDYKHHTEAEVKSDQYNGLVAVTKVLCEIDSIPAESYIDTLAYSVDPDFHPENPIMVEEAYALAELA